jgi:ubiquitin carboxyl-terminal hydrolase 9/13
MVCASSPIVYPHSFEHSYGNSILQCLFYSVPFREQVINFPQRSPSESVLKGPDGTVRLQPTLPFSQLSDQAAKLAKPVTTPAVTQPKTTATPQKPEDKDSQEYKKKQIITKGPLWAMRYDNASAYGMKESLFTCLKDLFEAIVLNQSRMGIIAPYRFFDVLKTSGHDMWGGNQHQDAHEFLNMLLNSVVDTVEQSSNLIDLNGSTNIDKSLNKALEAVGEHSTSKSTTNTRWVHEIFEGTLTSETKCLTCENVSQRDEPFLDLSVDLDAHSSVTACLRKFSAEEMLRERDKFFCDNCSGLQEAEKRMKIKRLPKILALHLKRFRYTEDMQRMYKLFHRVVYPYHLRLFNTTAEAEDPDRLYELYAVVVHIGAGPYHGHYVSIIKTQDRGWLLFDDELVEPVDKSFVLNFFGDKANLACAYVLFYQETTIEAVRREEEAEGRAAAAKLATSAQPAPVKESSYLGLGLSLKVNGLQNTATSPVSPEEDLATPLATLEHTLSAPQATPSLGSTEASTFTTPLQQVQTTITQPTPNIPSTPLSPRGPFSKKEREKEEKERKAAEKAAEKAAAKEAVKAGKEAAKAEKEAAKQAKAQKKEEEARLKQAVKISNNESQLTPIENQAKEKQKENPSLPQDPLSVQSKDDIPNGTSYSAINGTSTISNLAPSNESPHTTSNGPVNSPPPSSSATTTTITNGTSNHAHTSSTSSSTSAFNRFRHSSKSLKHRPKFLGGSSSSPTTTAASVTPIISSNGSVPPVPHPPTNGTSTGNTNGFGNGIPAAYSAKDESAVIDDSADSTTAIPGFGERKDSFDRRESRKRSSRFSLRRKGSNLLAFGNNSGGGNEKD